MGLSLPSLVAAAVAIPLSGLPLSAQERAMSASPASPELQSVTPVLTVEIIEPSLPFWTEGLGFSVIGQVPEEVPEGGALGFVMLQRGEILVMLQTLASVRDDLPALADDLRGSVTTLFIQVESVEPWVATPPPGATLAVERRTTFYGMDEIGFRTPDGTVVILAAQVESDGSG